MTRLNQEFIGEYSSEKCKKTLKYNLRKDYKYSEVEVTEDSFPYLTFLENNFDGVPLGIFKFKFWRGF